MSENTKENTQGVQTKNKVVGVFQTVNPDTGQTEWSMTRLQMAAMTVFVGFFLWFFFIGKGNEFNTGNIIGMTILLLAAFFPKGLKDVTDMLKKIKSVK